MVFLKGQLLGFSRKKGGVTTWTNNGYMSWHFSHNNDLHGHEAPGSQKIDRTMTNEELRAKYQASIQELLVWIAEETNSEGDTYGQGTVHYLNNGRLVLGVPGFDEYEYERVLYLWSEPNDWLHTYEGLTLWVVNLKNFSQEEENTELLSAGIEHALDALRGGPSLSELREYQTLLNAIRAVRCAAGMVNDMPVHLRIAAERVVQVYDNGNVVLSFQPSGEVSEEIQREFELSRTNHKLVFGTYGREVLRTVNLGVQQEHWTRLDFSHAVGLIMTTKH